MPDVLYRGDPYVSARLAVAISIWGVWIAASPATDRFSREFTVDAPGEGRARVVASCARCDWGASGREAVALRMSVDGKYSQHVVIVRGGETADYSVRLGGLARGRHRLTLERDPDLTAPEAGPASIDIPTVDVLVDPGDGGPRSEGPGGRGPRSEGPGGRGPRSNDLFMAQSMAPILYARPNTVGRFTDLPLLMWYEVDATPRGRRYRYSVVFSNEDGGTATDRLMATWGRTTDIELVYSVEVDDHNRVLAEEFQGPGHEMPPFRGTHEGRHPLLWVSTDNNMVSESGPTSIRYAPVPERFDLKNVSREFVMDRSPWTYAISAKEMFREGKVDDDASPGSGKIPDPRRYVHVEACLDLENAAVGFAVRGADAAGAPHWYDSDRGLSQFRIVRSGCFRGAVPVLTAAGAPSAIRFQAYSRDNQSSVRGGVPAAAGPGAPHVSLTRVNTVFMLNELFLPRATLFSWQGSIALPIDGDWRELAF